MVVVKLRVIEVDKALRIGKKRVAGVIVIPRLTV